MGRIKETVTLHDVLYLLPKDTFVGIWDCRGDPLKERKRGYENHPSQQRYQRVKNIPYERLRYILDARVSCIAHNEKGIFIQIMKDHEETKQSLRDYSLARKIAEEIRRNDR